jgi:hypothetical protein
VTFKTHKQAWDYGLVGCTTAKLNRLETGLAPAHDKKCVVNFLEGYYNAANTPCRF